jgi:uncharacterized Ntn-hydrolase superfamily protein
VGFAISSCCWDSGIVCRAEAEIGAIASQANGNLAFLPLFFTELNKKRTLESILSHFKKIDKKIETRQIGMITSKGDNLAFTGKKCAFWAGHKIGKDYSCQGNILVSSRVVKDMAKTFEKTQGSLIEKLYAALSAGDAAGGDARGKQSARLVVKKKNKDPLQSDTIVDINIEDHEEPVKEIGRILEVRNNILKGYQLYLKFAHAPEKEKLTALANLERFLQDKEDRAYVEAWTAVAEAFSKMRITDKAAYYYRKTLEISPNMVKLLRRQAKTGDIPREIAAAVLKEL